MNKLIYFTLLLLTTDYATNAQTKETLNLLPVPKEMQLQSGSLLISPGFTVAIHTPSPDTILVKAANRIYQHLSRVTGLHFAKEYIGFSDHGESATLHLHTKKVVPPTIGIDESYSLKVTNSNIVIEAATTSGALHALQTLRQLCTKNGNVFSFPQITINDSPRFKWRGLMIDVSRHFIPMDVLERNVDAMAAVKMNVLHLHLTDDQGFRIESKAWPLLHKKGSRGDYYSQARMKEFISYAMDRGIVIVPEFDMPGHSTSWFAGYPQLASAPGPYEPGPPVDFGQIKGKDLGSIMKLITTAPFPSIDPSKESTYTFLDKFLGEMATLFPSPYIHIGADENNGVAWKNNADIVAFMKKNKFANVHELQAYFVKRVQKIVQKKNKRMIGWEELFSKDLSADVTVQVWQNGDYLKKALENGNPALVSKGFYLDLFMPAYIHYNNPEIAAGSEASNKGQLMGGEAAQWTEIADKNNLETRIWPRAAVVAERLWSPAGVNDVEDMYRRLFVTSNQLESLGLQHIATYERSLKVFTNNENKVALQTLTDVITPIKGYKKLFAKISNSPEMLNQTAPLNEVSDIVFVDSDVQWRFRAAVRSYLANKDLHSEKIITDYLAMWQSNDASMQALFSNSMQLEKLKDHSKNLSLIAATGKMAMEKIRSGTPPSPEWIVECMQLLKDARRPIAETELAIVSEIESLVKQQLIALPASYPPF